MKKPFYSIGIIFKNEIRCLERCLKSLQPLRDAVPCELVMADTGSDDGSRAVAEQYADILFDFPWIDDFAAARNAVIDHCSGQWYISVDADEWLVGSVQELVEFSGAKNLPKNFAGYHIRNYQSVGLEVSENYVDFIAVRMARLSAGVRYEGCIHESWKDPKHQIIQVMNLDDTWFYHDGYAYVDRAAEKAKRDRNMALLKRKLEQNPNHLQTLMECVDCTKHSEPDEAAEYVKRAMVGVKEHWYAWDKFGAVVFRNAVSVAALHKMPELEQWVTEAEELFPNSIYTRVDVAYYAFSYYLGKEDFPQALCWGKKYLKGLDDYHAGRFDKSESMRGVMENIAPFWERKVRVLLPESYLNCGEPEKAFSTFKHIKGQELEDEKQVELCTLMLIRLYRSTMLDAEELMSNFWDQVGQPEPDDSIGEKRQKILLDTAAPAFSTKYWEEEAAREDFVRHGAGVFSKLEGKCVLGDAAAILAETDSSALTKKLSCVEDLERLPVHALYHALECGASFPSEVNPLALERMDMLAGRMAQDTARLFALSQKEAENLAGASAQRIAWVRGLALSAVHSFDWKAGTGGVDVARAYAKAERAFLSVCYAPGVLNEKNLNILPPLHRFGFYCAQAFGALDAGDPAGYVRLLGEGLAVCGGVKDMVEFLIDHTPQIQTQTPPAELQALADQVRTILAAYPPDDPAVAALKQSEAYQKVAYLIEGMEPPIMGGQPQ